MLQTKITKQQVMERIIMLVYQYMDYWIPILLILTFPFWILPTCIYFIYSKLFHISRCFMRIGSQLVGYSHPPQLSYAILNGNGRYLRENGENVHQRQFYDYTSRRFLTVGKFEPETKIVELQCDNQIGLAYFSEIIGTQTVFGLQSNRQILNITQNSLGLISYTQYDISTSSAGYDCILLFNLKTKTTNGIDLLKILAYCQHHLEQSGYIVFGDNFEPGELATYYRIFEGFHLKVVDHEDITKNMKYAKKLTERNEINFEKKAKEVIKSKFGWLFNKSEQETLKFTVIILQHAKQK